MYRVTNQTKAEHVRKLCRRAAGTHPDAKRIPFETPVSIDQDTQFDPDSVVSIKADGVRYYLCLTYYNDEPIACFVNRAEEVFSLEDIQAPRQWFKDECVFDGELCRYRPNPNEKIFLVFNALLVRGAHMFGHPYRSRLASITRSVSGVVLSPEERERAIDIIVSLAPSMHIIAKPYSSATDIKSMIRLGDDRSGGLFESDGLVITPLNDTMTCGRNKRLLKWKTHHTIDVIMRCTPAGAITLFAYRQGRPVPLKEALVHCNLIIDDKLKSIIRGAAVCRKAFGLSPKDFEEVVELDMRNGEYGAIDLHFVCIRRDKTGANDVVTIKRTLDSATSKIDATRLCQVFDVVTH